MSGRHDSPYFYPSAVTRFGDASRFWKGYWAGKFCYRRLDMAFLAPWLLCYKQHPKLMEQVFKGLRFVGL